MSLLEETKSLLRKYRIAPNKLKGQNFTVDPSVFERVIGHASLDKDDVVLDIGAGFGFLTKMISEKCKLVLAVESDKRLVSILRCKFQGLTNVQIIESNVLKMTVPTFNKVVSIPPYGISSRLLLWFFHQTFDCAVSVFQKEFANKLVADVGCDDYGWQCVFTNYYAEAEVLDEVPRSAFFPQPEVDSVIVQLKPWEFPPFEVHDEIVFERIVRFLFTQRNKKLRKVLLSFVKSNCPTDIKSVNILLERVPLGDKRVRDLAPEDFGLLANACSK
jgi:16S rRNA (adenine1518-N6/adenine1519-N6)-dimethyltransferase